jgi:SNF2 family DNA or RNA helicase
MVESESSGDEELEEQGAASLFFVVTPGMPPVGVPPKIAAALFDHQKKGVAWILQRFVGADGVRGGILGDGTGLGKTLQSVAAVAALVEAKLAHRVLIVAPAQLGPHWLRELGKWAPKLKVIVLLVIIHPHTQARV